MDGIVMEISGDRENLKVKDYENKINEIKKIVAELEDLVKDAK